MQTSGRGGADGRHDLPITKTATGVCGLDDILFGGLPVGRTTLLCGGPGTGKTVLAVEFLHHGARAGEPGVFVSFEERTEDLRANAAAMGMHLAEMEQAGALRVVHAPVPHGAVRAGEFDIQGLLALLDAHTRETGANRLVLDAIDVLMRVFGNPDREREELYVLHDWLRDRGLTVLLTVKSAVAVAELYPFLDYMADCVLLLDQRMAQQVRTRRLNVVKYRGSDFLPNEYPFVLSDRGVVILPVSSVSLVQQATAERVSSGSDALDKVLGGGYFRGSSVLLAGPSGTGKTTLAFTFALAACRRGEKVLYVTFEESAESLDRAMRSVGLSMSEATRDGTFRVLTAMPESRGVEQHLLAIFDVIDAFEPDHLVVDAISACRRMGSEDAAFDFSLRLLTVCRERGITCVYTNQTDRPQGLMQMTAFDMSSLIDTLISLSYQDEGWALTRRLVVVKSRGSAHSMRYHTFEITSDGLELATQNGAAGRGEGDER